MLDSAIQTLIIAQLNAGLAARAINGVTVKQNNQPRQLEAASTPGIYFSIAPRKKFGYPQRKDIIDASVTPNVLYRQTTQILHSRVTIGALVPNLSPATPYALTSGDLASVAYDILVNDDALDAYIAAGCSILRPQELSGIWFETSAGQNALWSSFDIIFTHADVFKTPGNAISGFNGVVTQVP